MLKHRLQTGITLSVVLLLAGIYMPIQGVLPILLLVTGLCLWEFYALLDASKWHHFKLIGMAGGLLLIALTWIGAHIQPSLPVEELVLFFICAAVFMAQIARKDPVQPWETMAGTFLGIMYVPFLFNFFVKLLTFTGDDTTGRLLILYLVVVVKLTDIGAYFVGCKFGKHKMIPRISPAKTWEGCFGGVATAMIGSLVFYQYAHTKLHLIHMTAVDALALGFLLAVSGIVGDLIESMFKRSAGVKDSGRLLKGMGGVLDVMDSLLFAAPVLYVYCRLVMAP